MELPSPNNIIQHFIRPEDRAKTFKMWPKGLRQTHLRLQSSGFIYIGKSDIVYCTFCGLLVGDWTTDDDPFEVHYRLSQNCSYITCHYADLRERFEHQLQLPGRPTGTIRAITCNDEVLEVGESITNAMESAYTTYQNQGMYSLEKKMLVLPTGNGRQQ